jgi:hypothetical protein
MMMQGLANPKFEKKNCLFQKCFAATQSLKYLKGLSLYISNIIYGQQLFVANW